MLFHTLYKNVSFDLGFTKHIRLL